MDVFPAFFPLAGRRVGLAGEGEGLDARLRLLGGGPGDLVVLDAVAAASADAWAGMALAFVAHPEEAFAARFAGAAREAGVPVNVMDRPALCDFTVPALIDRGALVAAFGTGGASPLIAARCAPQIPGLHQAPPSRQASRTPVPWPPPPASLTALAEAILLSPGCRVGRGPTDVAADRREANLGARMH